MSVTGKGPAGRQSGRIFLVGYYGVDNLGDEAIRHAIERAAAILGTEITYFASRRPDPDPRAVPTGLRAVLPTLRAIRATDRVVLGGGGILKDEGMRLPMELLLTAVLARLAGRPVDLLAVGVGPFYHRVGRWLVAAIGRLSRHRTVRDEDSAIALRKLGVSRVVVGADPIFSYEPMESDGDRAIGDRATTDRATTSSSNGAVAPGRAAVSVRPWFDRLDRADGGDREARLMADLATGLAPLRTAGWSIDLLALYWPRDRDAGGALAARLGDGPGMVNQATGALDWATLTAAVRDTDLVVAMRYHAVAAAALVGRPVVAIAYEPKVASLAADLAIPTVSVDDAARGQQLREIVAAVAGGGPRPVADQDAIDSLRERAWSTLRTVLSG